MYAATDWSTFRAAFDIPLSSYPGASLTTQHPAPPSGSNNCADPGAMGGTHGMDFEATIDAEYASAAAPGAAIVLATCANGPSINGVLVAITNLVNGSNRPAIISVSYGGCEAALGASVNYAFSSIYQTAVAGGTSIYVASGDNSAMDCNIAGVATTGIGVNGYASTPYNVAVGGTDFADTFGQIRRALNDPPILGVQQRIEPRIGARLHPGNSVEYHLRQPAFALYHGYSTTYGSSGFCNSGSKDAVLGAVGGGGGPSGCATGSPSVPNVVSGTCAGYKSRVAERGRTARHAEQLCAQSSRCFDVRCGQPMGSRLYCVLFRSHQWRSTLHHLSHRLDIRWRRHVLRGADLGPRPGADQPA